MKEHNSNTIIGLAILLSSVLTGCTQTEAFDPRTEAPVVPVVQVQHGSGDWQSFTGTVGARVVSNLGFRVPGKITERLVDTGEAVKKGQALYRLDRTDFAHTIAARQNSVASKHGDVEARRGEVQAKQSAVDAARARLVEAEADEKRYRSAVSVGVVTEQAYDQYKAAADTARAQLKSAQSEAAAAQSNVIAAQAEVKSLQAEEKVAENEGSYSTIFADSDGIIVETIGEPGQVITAGQTIVKLAHNGPREAVVNLPETLRPALNSTAQAELYGDNKGHAKSHLRQLSDAADPSTRTFEARYVLEGYAANAPLGATITITLPSKNGGGNTVIPLSAIVDRGDGPNVWTVDGRDIVHLSPIKIKTLEEESASIASGLAQGQAIVAVGAHLLYDGEKIRTAKYEAMQQ